MMAKSTSKGVTKDKHGRGKEKCKAYRSAGLRERHKAHRLDKHLEVQPNDLIARASRKSMILVKPLRRGKGLRAVGVAY